MTAAAFQTAYRAFRPSPEIRTLPWAIENIVNDQGRAYDHAAYPHLGAPGGPMDAFDDPRIRSISLQWATRLGKTFFGQLALLKTADTDPAPMMFASSVEKLAKEGAARIYASAHQRKHLNDLLLRNEREQKQDLVEFRGSKIFVAWSRSVSTLADKNIKVGHAGEYDKWEHQSTSREAHPHKLFDDRMKDYQAVRRAIYEGTPTIKGKSPIEHKRLTGSNCQYHVPCPHCRKYQVLEFGGRETPQGIKWDRGEGGKQNPDIAYRTAHYVCLHCGEKCEDHHRAWMMRRGLWVPEGAKIKHKPAFRYAEKCLENPAAHRWEGWANAKWIEGKPARDGQEYSSQLSSWYALSLGWGDMAAEFLKSRRVPQWLRNFINQWAGETWELFESKQTWEELGRKIIVATPHRVIPAGCGLVTMGIDKQLDHYVANVDAWKLGDSRTSHTLHYGIYSSLEALEQAILDTEFAREDGGALGVLCTLIDGRYRPHEVYQFCLAQTRKRRAVFPAFGSPNNMGVECRKTVLGENTPMPGFPCVHVDVTATNDFINRQLEILKPGDPGSTTLYNGSLAEHQDYLQQLLNEAQVSELDSNGYTKETWKRIDENVPNDYRDAKRLAYVAMIVSTRNAEVLEPGGGRAAANREEPQAKQGPQKKTRFNFRRRREA